MEYSITTIGDQPLNSTKEADHQEQDVIPGGRLYECIFCKRGFTTAQALGGHMNIHRKDRAKSTRLNRHLSNSISNKLQEEDNGCYESPRFHPSSYISEGFSDHEEGMIRNYRTCFSSTSKAVIPVHREDNLQDVHPSSLCLKFGGGNEEDELDLELRLGYNP